MIDARILALVEAVVRKIDEDPLLLDRLGKSVERWPDQRLREKWQKLLRWPWSVLRVRLLEKNDAGDALRQEAPLGGILTPAERTAIMRQFKYDPRAA